MGFEELIERANDFYFANGIALINKQHTAVKFERRYNPLKKRSDIVGAYPQKKATVDFLGQYGSKPVAFEAKSTSNKNRWPIKMLKEHQYIYLKKAYELNAASFILIECINISAIYLLKFEQLEAFMANHERKSIPFDYFDRFCQKCTINERGILHYLENIEEG